MKFGMRKISPMKSLKARTTSKKNGKKSINPRLWKKRDGVDKES